MGEVKKGGIEDLVDEMIEVVGIGSWDRVWSLDECVRRIGLERVDELVELLGE